VRGRDLIGVVVVATVALLTALVPERHTEPIRYVTSLTPGLFVAAGATALVAYRERRDPTLLLVGVGASAIPLHALALLLLFDLAERTTTGVRLEEVLGFAPAAGLLALAGNLLLVVPWRDRRGRPPLAPRVVVGATVALLVGLDVLAAFADGRIVGFEGRLGPLAWLSLAALAVIGAIVAFRSLGWGGRFGWVAASGLAIALVGAGTILAVELRGGAAERIASVPLLGTALAAGSLLVFDLASLRLESSRMRRATDRAEEVLVGRAEVAAMVAHDVRGPLGTMKGLATTIRKSYEQLGDEERLEFIGMIERESSRLLALVDHIALALKVDARALDIDLRAQPLAPLVRKAAEAQDLPPHPMDVDVPEDLRARLDARWFPVALGEALSNAARYSQDDAPIEVSARVTPAWIVVEVADRGPGVPPEHREEVFRRFARWRPVGYEDRPGSGLGLFICRGIAREHGGDASLVERPEGGTICRIELPMEGTERG
jgi:signal transduction histidine kinase